MRDDGRMRQFRVEAIHIGIVVVVRDAGVDLDPVRLAEGDDAEVVPARDRPVELDRVHVGRHDREVLREVLHRLERPLVARVVAQ